jgi:hypothetical protein
VVRNYLGGRDKVAVSNVDTQFLFLLALRCSMCMLLQLLRTKRKLAIICVGAAKFIMFFAVLPQVSFEAMLISSCD